MELKIMKFRILNVLERMFPTWGFSAMPQIKTKHKQNFKQNLQSLCFSRPNFDRKENIMQMSRIL